MPWYTEFRSEQDFSQFVTFLQNKKEIYGCEAGVGDQESTRASMGAWGCTDALQGHWRQTGNRQSISLAPTATTGGYTGKTFRLAMRKMDVEGRSVLMRQPREPGIDI